MESRRRAIAVPGLGLLLAVLLVPACHDDDDDDGNGFGSPGGTNGGGEVFVPVGSGSPSLSRNGELIAFASDDPGIVAGDDDDRSDVFLFRRNGRETIRVTEGADGPSGNPSLSADGSVVAFESRATTLVSGGASGLNVFLRDLATGETVLASAGLAGVPADGDSRNPSVSGDGRFVAFESGASNLVPGVSAGRRHVYRFDRRDGSVALVSRTGSGGEADGDSRNPSISADGRRVAFESDAGNLDERVATSGPNVFLADLGTGSVRLVSEAARRSDGLFVAADGASRAPALSPDGHVVAFESDATNLAPGVATRFTQVFARDFSDPAEETVLVSRAFAGTPPLPGPLPDGPSRNPSIDDGRTVVFESLATNLGPVGLPATGSPEIFAFNLGASGTPVLVSDLPGNVVGGNADPGISPSGLLVAWETRELRPAGFRQVVARNLLTGEILLVSPSAQTPTPPPTTTGVTLGTTPGTTFGTTPGTTFGTTVGTADGTTLGTAVGVAVGTTFGTPPVGASPGTPAVTTTGVPPGTTFGFPPVTTTIGASVGATFGTTFGMTDMGAPGTTFGTTFGAPPVGASPGTPAVTTTGVPPGTTFGFPPVTTTVGASVGATFGTTFGATSTGGNPP